MQPTISKKKKRKALTGMGKVALQADDAGLVEAARQIDRQERMIAASQALQAARAQLAALYMRCIDYGYENDDDSAAMYAKRDILQAQNAVDEIQLEIATEVVAAMKQQLDAVKKERGIA